MTKQRKHAKKSTIKKKRRRMRINAEKHSAVAREKVRIKHDYAPYQIGKESD